MTTQTETRIYELTKSLAEWQRIGRILTTDLDAVDHSQAYRRVFACWPYEERSQTGVQIALRLARHVDAGAAPETKITMKLTGRTYWQLKDFETLEWNYIYR